MPQQAESVEKIIRRSRLLTEPHHQLIGTIPFAPSDDAEWRGRHFKSSEPIPTTDPNSHTPAND